MKELLALSFLPLLLLQIGFVQPLSREVRTLNQGKSSIIFSRFMPTLNELVSASSDGNIALWNTKTGQRMWQTSLKKSNGAEFTIPTIINLSLSSDGQTIGISYWQRRVVIGRLMKGDENRIALLDATSGQLKRDFVTDKTLEHAIDFSPRGQLIASASANKQVHLWNIETGKEILTIETKERPILVVFSPNERLLAIATEPPSWITPPDPMIGIYDAQSGALVRTIPRRRRNVSILEFSPDSQSLAVVTEDGRGAVIDLWDLTAKEPKRTLTDHEGGITAIAFSNDGRLLASGDLHNGRGKVVVRDVATNAQPRVRRLSAGIGDLNFSADNCLLAAGTDSGRIVLMTP
jgi:WD40 repeat protein